MNNTLKDELKKDRLRIHKSINNINIFDPLVSMIQRAEMLSKSTKEDVYITSIENGIAFYVEKEFEKISERVISEMRNSLTEKNISKEKHEFIIDRLASSLVVHYIDYKKFTSDELELYNKITLQQGL